MTKIQNRLGATESTPGQQTRNIYTLGWLGGAAIVGGLAGLESGQEVPYYIHPDVMQELPLLYAREVALQANTGGLPAAEQQATLAEVRQDIAQVDTLQDLSSVGGFVTGMVLAVGAVGTYRGYRRFKGWYASRSQTAKTAA